MISRIELGKVEGDRFRSCGCNARLPVHGWTITDPVMRVSLDNGLSGVGWSVMAEADARKLLGRRVDELISVDAGGIIDSIALGAEMALWDLLGHMTGQPVYQLLGKSANRDETISAAVYDTSLYFDDIDIESDDEACALLKREAREGWDRGHRHFKMKVGRGAMQWTDAEAGTRRDIAVIKAVREAVGPEATLMIDANNGYNVNLAKRVLTETRGCRLHWLEEPFHEDPITSAHLKQWLRNQGDDLSQVLIADGEGAAAPQLLEYARNGAIDVVQYSAREKGFTFWIRLNEELQTWGCQSAPHNFGSSLSNYATAHLATLLGCFVEWDYAATVGLLGVDSYVLENGRVSIPNKPGFGWKLDDDVFRPTIILQQPTDKDSSVEAINSN